VSLLRRLLGGRSGGEGGESGESGEGGRATDDEGEPEALAADDEDERALERDLAREEAERLDELQQRQLRFAAYSWKPADQGGARRAGEEESANAEGEAGTD
jgi:hypothetical protein